MKKTLFVTLFVMALSAVAMAGPETGASAGAGDTPWFDLENCAFCKNLMQDPELMDHMSWETHEISNGAMIITTVDPGYEASYEKACAAMEGLGEKMMSGEVNPMSVKVCGHCRTWGQLMMAGVKTEVVKGDQAEVTLMTGDTPELVAQIHEYAERNEEEMARMAEAETAGEDPHHHGHDH